MKHLVMPGVFVSFACLIDDMLSGAFAPFSSTMAMADWLVVVATFWGVALVAVSVLRVVAVLVLTVAVVAEGGTFSGTSQPIASTNIWRLTCCLERSFCSALLVDIGREAEVVGNS